MATKRDEFSKDLLFRAPPCISAKISPNSKTIAYVGADEGGILNVFIRAPEETDSTQVSFFKTPEIIQFFWSPNSDKVLLLKDEDGTGLLHLYHLAPENPVIYGWDERRFF